MAVVHRGPFALQRRIAVWPSNVVVWLDGVGDRDYEVDEWVVRRAVHLAGDETDDKSVTARWERQVK